MTHNSLLIWIQFGCEKWDVEMNPPASTSCGGVVATRLVQSKQLELNVQQSPGCSTLGFKILAVLASRLEAAKNHGPTQPAALNRQLAAGGVSQCVPWEYLNCLDFFQILI